MTLVHQDVAILFGPLSWVSVISATSCVVDVVSLDVCDSFVAPDEASHLHLQRFLGFFFFLLFNLKSDVVTRVNHTVAVTPRRSSRPIPSESRRRRRRRSLHAGGIQEIDGRQSAA